MAEELIQHVFESKDYYEILDIPQDATPAEVKAAFRKKALMLHPDKCQLEGAKNAFQRLSNAHMCLMDAEKREVYDRTGEAGGEVEMPDGDWEEELFDMVFREMMIEQLQGTRYGLSLIHI